MSDDASSAFVSDQVRRLQAELRNMQAERDRAREAQQAAELRAETASRDRPAAGGDVHAGSVAQPNNLANIKMDDLQQQLGFDSEQWNALRTAVRDALSAACLDPNAKWKAQAPGKLSAAYNAVEEDFPQLRRFANQWAVVRIAKQCWSNRRSYCRRVGNESTYRGRRAAARRTTRDVSPPDPSPSHHRRIHCRST